MNLNTLGYLISYKIQYAIVLGVLYKQPRTNIRIFLWWGLDTPAWGRVHAPTRGNQWLPLPHGRGHGQLHATLEDHW